MSLARFAAQTGSSVGFANDLPQVRTRRVRGMMAPIEALKAMLDGTGLRARQVGKAYRIEHAPRPSRSSVRPMTAPPAQPAHVERGADIVVTAQKRPERLTTLPLSVGVVALDPPSSGLDTPSARDISQRTEGLAMTNLGPGRNRLFIRGVADSPFVGKSQSTVAVQIDDARATFDAPDPDLHLLDMERVEILKGPQGPLYGSGALGGIYHVVTRRPDLATRSASIRTGVSAVEHGGASSSVEMVANLPIVTDTLALRAVSYRVGAPGWIDNADGRMNTNSARSEGARLALRWRPGPGWTIDGGIIIQDIDVRDSQYVLAGEKAQTRDNVFAEPTDNDFRMIHATIERRTAGLRLTAATSFVDQGFTYALDASAAAASFGLAAPARFKDDRAYSVFNQELRLSPLSGGNWLAGTSYMRATTKGRSTVTGATGLPLTVETSDRETTEYALFGEITWPLTNTIKATTGARLFRSTSRDLATQRAGQRVLERSSILVSPSAALSMPLSGGGIVYLRYARAKRPAGLAPSDTVSAEPFESDKLGTIELGMRRDLAGGGALLSANVFRTAWERVQSDYLLPNGLISTRNAGRASIIGIEAGLDWALRPGLGLSAGGAVQRAHLTRLQDGSELDDQRLPVVPAFTARLALDQAIGIADWVGRAIVQGNYVGRSRLSFDEALDRAMGNFAIVSASATLGKGAWSLGAKIDNMLDVKGDSFAFGNPFTIRSANQFTPVRPRALSLSVTRRF